MILFVKTDIQIDIGQNLEINSHKGAKNFTGEGDRLFNKLMLHQLDFHMPKMNHKSYIT